MIYWADIDPITGFLVRRPEQKPEPKKQPYYCEDGSLAVEDGDLYYPDGGLIGG